MRALLPYLPILLAVGLTIFTVIDIALIDPLRVKGLPKLIWILICIILLVIGPVLWFLLGRERLEPATPAEASARARVADRSPRTTTRSSSASSAARRAQEERIRDLEQQLREIDDDPEDKPKE